MTRSQAVMTTAPIHASRTSAANDSQRSRATPEPEGGTAIIDVSFALDPEGLGVTDWDIRVFEKVTDARYDLHHERIGELALPLDRVRGLLADRFELLEEVDEDGLPATDTSVKAYYALRRRE